VGATDTNKTGDGLWARVTAAIALIPSAALVASALFVYGLSLALRIPVDAFLEPADYVAICPRWITPVGVWFIVELQGPRDNSDSDRTACHAFGSDLLDSGFRARLFCASLGDRERGAPIEISLKEQAKPVRGRLIFSLSNRVLVQDKKGSLITIPWEKIVSVTATQRRTTFAVIPPWQQTPLPR
jgi:hypothetical protein